MSRTPLLSPEKSGLGLIRSPAEPVGGVFRAQVTA
jgi:hypothetical protein